MNNNATDMIHELENMTESNKDTVLSRASQTDLEMFTKFFNKHTMNPQTELWAKEVLEEKERRTVHHNKILLNITNTVVGIIALAAIMFLSQKFLK